MGQNVTAEEARRILVNGGFSLTPDADVHEARWTDGLPHDFMGWGPRTPDSDHPVIPQQPVELQWSGPASDNHHVWRFDGRRRHH